MRAEIEPFAANTIATAVPTAKKLSRVAAILEPGERILWTGQPVASYFFQRSLLLWAILGVILAGLTTWAFTACLFTQSPEAGANLVIALLVDLFVAVSLWLRLNEAYFVTNRRAFIMGGNLLKPIYIYTRQHVDPAKLEVVQDVNGYGDIIFAEEIDLEGTPTHSGFNSIAEPETVAMLLRQVFAA